MEVYPVASGSKRKPAVDGDSDGPWKLSKCQKFPPEKFKAWLEICSPDSFFVKPVPVDGYSFPGEDACFEKLSYVLSNVVPTHYTQDHGGGEACVFKLSDYDAVVKCLKIEGIECEKLPFQTYNVLKKLLDASDKGRWESCRPDYISDEKVNELMGQLPESLLQILLPFQVEGVKFGLRRGGRCLIADEMGLGKTLQAIAIAGCYMSEGPILVVCPAILRYTWAEELERWLPSCLPSDIHLVFCRQDNPVHLARSPRVVVISYKMLQNLRKSILQQKWAVLIVDESHHLHCTKRPTEASETQAVLDVAAKVNHIVLLSGTPSLSRPFDIFYQIDMLWPGLLGQNKYKFADLYCARSFVNGYQDFSKGVRLEELNVLLKQTVMIRRMKEQVLMQLPPIRRQIITLVLKKSDINLAKDTCPMASDNSTKTDGEEEHLANGNECDSEVEHGSCKSSIVLSNQGLGIAKLSGFLEWLSMHPIIAELKDDEKFETSHNSHKMIIFVHFHIVTDKLQEFLCEKKIGFVRIDSQETSARDRQQAIQTFQHSQEVKIALVGIRAGGTGVDLSAAENVVFLELPDNISDFQQAESRAHRRGQTKAVNVYIFCAKDTADESRWKKLNRSLNRVSSTVDGKYGSLQEIEVESVSSLQTIEGTDRREKVGLPRETNSEFSNTLLTKCCKSAFGHKLQSDDPFDGTNGATDMNEEKKGNGCHSRHQYGNKGNVLFGINMGEHVLSNGAVEEEYIHEAKLEYGGSSSHSSIEGHKSCVTTMSGDAESLDQVEAGVSCFPVHLLRFEVSKYTGRIHLYSCIPGVESRPRPLFENFRPEELETKDLPIQDNKKLGRKYFKDDPMYRPALVAFIKEWNRLRPIEQSNLFNKPLQLPLSVELCLNRNPNHNKEGLLNGGSKKRGTPLDEISQPLPPNAEWRTVSLFRGKKERQYQQGWTLMDEPLCKLCQKLCNKKNAKVPEFFEDLFCELECYQEYRLRTSNTYLRKEILQIERGICTNCHLDCRKLVKNIKPLSIEKRREFILREAPKVAARPNLYEKLVADPTDGNAWHADHIVPVYKGGGECRLENMRTLCVACHAEVTAAQCSERRLEKAKAKKHLNLLLANLENIQDLGKTDDKQKMKTPDIVEDELLINVPGSAYDRTTTKRPGSKEVEKASKDQVLDVVAVSTTLN